MKVQKVEGRAEYLRHVLSKTVAAEVLDKPNLTHGDVVNANSLLYEYWRLTRRADVDRALGQPAGQAAAKQSKDNVSFRRFSTGQGWTPDEHKEMLANIERLVREYPAFVRNQPNGEALAIYLLENRLYPSYPSLVQAFTTLAVQGKLLLNPSAVNIPEDRYGDELYGPHAMSRVSAADLKLMTTPFRSQTEPDAIRKMSADEYYRSEHGRALREERNRHADQAICQQEIRQAEAAVEFFLSSNRDYARTNDNRDQILGWLKDHNLPITQNTLQQAFEELKHQLALSPDSNAEYGASRVIDYSDIGPTNPMHTRPPKQHVELVEQKSVRKVTMADLRKMSSEQYQGALNDTDLAPQIEALLADQ